MVTQTIPRKSLIGDLLQLQHVANQVCDVAYHGCIRQLIEETGERQLEQTSLSYIRLVTPYDRSKGQWQGQEDKKLTIVFSCQIDKPDQWLEPTGRWENTLRIRCDFEKIDAIWQPVRAILSNHFFGSQVVEFEPTRCSRHMLAWIEKKPHQELVLAEA